MTEADFIMNTGFLSEEEKQTYRDILAEKAAYDVEVYRDVVPGQRFTRKRALSRSNECVSRMSELAQINGDREYFAVIGEYLKGQDLSQWWMVDLGDELGPIFSDPYFDPPDDAETWANYYEAAAGEFRAKFADLPDQDIILIDARRFTTLCGSVLVRSDSAFMCRLQGRNVIPCVEENLVTA